jgi:hypothetical protein
MAKYGVTNVAGGGGIGSDEISVTKEYVLNGKTYVGSDTNDEIGTGTMANNGSTVNQSLNAGGFFSVKKGYHSQDFTVNSNNLANQTPGNAIPSHVLNGESYWTNGNKLTGSMIVQSVLSFNCAPYSASQIIFTWQNPSSGPFSGVIIVGKAGGYPANVNDGTWYYKGFGNNINALGVSGAVVGGFGMNVTYYFKAFSYAVINGVDCTSGTTRITSLILQHINQVIASSTIWTIPFNVNYIDIFCVGGGAGGGNGETGDSTYAAWGGNGGQTINVYNVSVSPNSQLQVIIGSGGIHSYAGGNGGATTVYYGGQVVCNAMGGKNSYTSGVGYYGSGGGAGVRVNAGNTAASRAGNGGSDGSKGGNNEGYKGGEASGTNGQSRTTKPFENPNGTPYSGGGGGGGNGGDGGYNEYPGEGGYYGGGGGAMLNLRNAITGTPNSGGGGGGGATGMGYKSSSTHDGADGGSGICIIRYIG